MLVVHSTYPESPAAAALRQRRRPGVRRRRVGRRRAGAARRSQAERAASRSTIELAPLEPPAPGYAAAREFLAAAGRPDGAERAVRRRSRRRSPPRPSSATQSCSRPPTACTSRREAASCSGSPTTSARRGRSAELDARELSVEAMAPLDEGVELIVGAKRDPRFGAVVLVGLGGVYAEILDDVAVALAPSARARPSASSARFAARRLLDGCARPAAARRRGSGSRPSLPSPAPRLPARARRARREPAARAAGGRARARRARGARVVESARVNTEVFITCAVTGVGATTDRSELVPVTPLADRGRGARGRATRAPRSCTSTSGIPETGGPSRDPALYREVVERIRASDVDVVLNLTAGMGGDLVLGGVESPLPPSAEGTDMAGATERLEHVAELRPEICTLDCGTMNFAEGDYVMTNTPSMLREMARQIQALGVRPGDRGLRHRPPRVREAADRRGPRRRAGDAPALHGHPVRRARRPGDAARAREPAARRAASSPRSRSGACSSRTSRSRRSSAGTCGSGSRTTSGSSAA